MNVNEISPLDLLVEKNIEVEVELEELESKNINSRLRVFFGQFPLISKVFYACGLKSCFVEYQNKVDGYKEDSIDLFKHDNSINVIASLYERAELESCLNQHVKMLNGEELFYHSSCRLYLYQMFCIGYFKANVILEGNTVYAVETYRKCSAYVLLNSIEESYKKLTSRKEKKLSDELDRLETEVDMFKMYNIEIPALLSEKIRIIKKILNDNKIDPICKSFSNDDLLDIFGIEKPDIQEEIDEV